LGFFIGWVLKYFTLFTGIHEKSNRKYHGKYYEIPGNTGKYFAKNMKYQEILEKSCNATQVSGYKNHEFIKLM
jgi:hypothetical protein